MSQELVSRLSCYTSAAAVTYSSVLLTKTTFTNAVQLSSKPVMLLEGTNSEGKVPYTGNILSFPKL
jgi:hypothetical protein